MTTGKLNALTKNNILSSDVHIKQLFAGGQRLHNDYVNIIYDIRPAQLPTIAPNVKLLFAAPKRLLLKAHQRNHIKRLMRESIRTRLNELKLLCKQKNISLHVAFVFAGKNKNFTFKEVQNDVVKIIDVVQNYTVNN